MRPEKTVFSSAMLIQPVQFQAIGACSLSSPPTLVTVGCNMGTHYVALHYEKCTEDENVLPGGHACTVEIWITSHEYGDAESNLALFCPMTTQSAIFQTASPATSQPRKKSHGKLGSEIISGWSEMMQFPNPTLS